MVATRTTLPDLDTLNADALKAILLATHERFVAQHKVPASPRRDLPRPQDENAYPSRNRLHGHQRMLTQRVLIDSAILSD